MNALLFALLSSLTSPSADAATLTVAQDGSADYATIQDAVDAARPGDVIRIDSGDYGSATLIRSITLTALSGADVRMDHLDVLGEGTSATVRGITFTCESGPVSVHDAELRLVGTTFAEIDAPRSVLFSHDGRLVLEESELRALTGEGELVSVFGGSLELRGTTVEEVEAERHAICTHRARVIVQDSQFSEVSSEGDGGAIAVYGGELELGGSTFEDGSSEGDGGQVYVLGASSVRIEDTSFSGCHAEGDGGSVALELVDDAWLSSVSFESSSATRGGALSTTQTVLEGEDLDFLLDSAVEWGGHAAFSGGSEVSLTRVFMISGQAEAGAGLLAQQSSVEVTNAGIMWNKADEAGGGALVDGGSLELVHATIASNSSPNGAAVEALEGTARLYASITFQDEGDSAYEGSMTGLVSVELTVVDEGRTDSLTSGQVTFTDPFFGQAGFTSPPDHDYTLTLASPGLDAVPNELDPDGTVADCGMYGGPEAWELPDEDGDGYVAGRDCDDSDPGINESVEDMEGDGLDRNCDGVD